MPPSSRRNEDAERAPLLDQPEESRRIQNYALPLLLVSAATFLTGLLTVIGVFLILSTQPAAPSLSSHQSGIPTSAFLEGLRKCKAIASAEPQKNAVRVRNPRVRPGEFRPVVIENAHVWDGDGKVLENVKVVIQDGLIVEIGEDANIPSDAQIFDAKGHVVTPGLVDMHSHMGVDSWPELDATSDTNEMTNPALPQLRSLDAFNPHDPAIRIIASGGVTTSLVLPGSGNLMGGEAYAFKHRHPKSHSAEEMLVNAGLDEEKDSERGWRWMKMACGENPKRVYGSENVMPSTRMGSAYLFRQRLAQAREVLEKQDDWCDLAMNLTSSDNYRMPVRFPEDIKQESLVALLRGRVKLNIHCYETHDIEMLIRTARENPGLEIAAFHHALDAYKIPEILRRLPNNVTIATFADHWGYKKEAFQASVRSPAELAAEGIPVALKSDHPVLNAQHLIYEAQKAHHYGLDEQLALAAVTSVPARAMGIGHRLGKLAVGYDADIVIWNKHPLSMGARPVQVFIDGNSLLDSTVDVGLDARDLVGSTAPPASETSAKPMKAEGDTSCTSKSTSFIVRNIGHIVMDKDQEHHSRLDRLSDQFTIVVEDGIIICAGILCTGKSRQSTMDSYDLNGGWVIPGILGVAEGLGLVEIPPEHQTSDGMRSSTLDPSLFTFAVDGLQLGNGKHLAAAYKGGVTTGVVGPLGYDGLVKGWMVAYSTGADTVIDETKPIVSSVVGLLLQIGQSGKDAKTPSISSQVSALRKLMNTCQNATDENLLLLANGDLPFVIHAHSADSIAQILLLRESYPSVNFVIHGGAEAYVLRKQLADARIGVILNPPRCTMGTWETRRCLSGMPLEGHTGLDLLLAAGVDVALGVEEDGFARNLIWEAGWAQATGSAHKLSDAEAIGLVTWNVANILGLDRPSKVSSGNMQSPGTIRVGQRAEFVGFSSRPLEFGAKVQMVVGGGKTGVTCWPVQQ